MFPTLNPLIARQAVPEPEPEFIAKVEKWNSFTNRWDLVADTYGPGVLIAWILIAGAAVADVSDNVTRGIDTIERSLAMTVSYSIGIACHLIILAKKFPGPKSEIWNTTDSELAPHVGAVWVSFRCCAMTLAAHVALFVRLLFLSKQDTKSQGFSRPWKRNSFLGLSIVFIFSAICVASDPTSTPFLLMPFAYPGAISSKYSWMGYFPPNLLFPPVCLLPRQASGRPSQSHTTLVDGVGAMVLGRITLCGCYCPFPCRHWACIAWYSASHVRAELSNIRPRPTLLCSGRRHRGGLLFAVARTTGPGLGTPRGTGRTDCIPETVPETVFTRGNQARGSGEVARKVCIAVHTLVSKYYTYISCHVFLFYS